MSGTTTGGDGDQPTVPGTPNASLSHLPWTMIPSFRPGDTDINEYTKKLEFLASLWPPEHLSHLAPRAAMMCERQFLQACDEAGPSQTQGEYHRRCEAVSDYVRRNLGQKQFRREIRAFWTSHLHNSAKGRWIAWQLHGTSRFPIRRVASNGGIFCRHQGLYSFAEFWFGIWR